MIIYYHNVYPDPVAEKKWSSSKVISLSAFKRHLDWLRRYYNIISLSDYVENLKYSKKCSNKQISITFDDGLKNTFKTIFPVLQEKNMPVTFFVSTGHIGEGPLLWFVFLNALCYGRMYDEIFLHNQLFPLRSLKECRNARASLAKSAKASGDPVKFCNSIAENYPLNESLKSEYGGMTYEQLKTAGSSDLIEIGAHGKLHHYLDQLQKETQMTEIFGNKSTLGSLTGKEVKYFAYPSGAYNEETIEILKSERYEAGFAVRPKRISKDGLFEIERVGIYSNSLVKFLLKINGFEKLTRRVLSN